MYTNISLSLNPALYEITIFLIVYSLFARLVCIALAINYPITPTLCRAETIVAYFHSSRKDFCLERSKVTSALNGSGRDFVSCSVNVTDPTDLHQP